MAADGIGNLNAPYSSQIIDPVLTNFARAYRPHGFIYDQLVNRVSVSTLSGQYPIFPKDYWYSNDVDNLTRDRAATREIDFKWSTETYLAKEYALKVSITDLERQQAHQALRLEQNKTDFLSLRMTMAREQRLATLLDDPAQTTGGGFTSGNSAAPTAWDNTGSNPEADVRTAALAMYDATGQQPNVIVIPYKVAYFLATIHGTDTLRNQIQYTANIEQYIKEGVSVLPNTLFGLRVIVPMGPQSQAGNEGASAPTYSDIWGKKVRLLYVDPSAGWGTPSVCQAFTHTPQEVTRWREIDPDVEYIRQRERVVEKVTAPDLGYVLRSIIS